MHIYGTVEYILLLCFKDKTDLDRGFAVATKEGSGGIRTLDLLFTRQAL